MAEKKNILTYAGLKQYEDELQNLKVFKRKEVAQKIKEAREQGDLSENAEYDAAKDEQRDIEARIEELEKLLKNEKIKKYPEDTDLLEDVIIENKQAIEMANIYSGILSGMMDAFASVISNNLNIVMKFLAAITIVMSIPTMVSSFYGMNVNEAGMPFASSPWGFLIIFLFAVALSLLVAVVFHKKDFL